MTKKMILSGSELFARAGHTLRLAVKRGRVLLALWPAFSRLNRTSLERQRNNEQHRRSSSDLQGQHETFSSFVKRLGLGCLRVSHRLHYNRRTDRETRARPAAKTIAAGIFATQ